VLQLEEKFRRMNEERTKRKKKRVTESVHIESVPTREPTRRKYKTILRWQVGPTPVITIGPSTAIPRTLPGAQDPGSLELLEDIQGEVSSSLNCYMVEIGKFYM
jgi:hypothetical protein